LPVEATSEPSVTTDAQVVQELTNNTELTQTASSWIEPCKLLSKTSILCNDITTVNCDDSCYFYEENRHMWIKNLDGSVARIKDFVQVNNAVQQSIKEMDISFAGDKYIMDTLRERNNFITKLILPRIDSTVQVPIRTLTSEMGN